MIPRRLRLRNFLSYRDCEIDFSPLHLATLAGRNGDGKSSLLDAITWALWGEARGARADDRIRQGSDEMRVELDFDVDRDRYRVIRKRTRGRSGALDVFQLDSQGGLHSITGGVLRETQAELNRRVHMDYQTFINSVFLVQGRSNEFTAKTPSERKEVLRKVLGLERYEALSSLAHDRRKSAKAEAEVEERLISADEAKIAEAPAVEENLKRVAAERETVRAKLTEEEQERDELRIAAAEHENRKQTLTDVTDRLNACAAAVKRRTGEIEALERKLADVRKTLEDASAIEERHALLEKTREEAGALADLAAQATDLEQDLAAASSEIEQERRALETSMAALEEEREASRALVATLPALRREAADLDRERDRLAALVGDIQTAQDKATEAANAQARRESEAQGFRDRAQELKEREKTLAEAEGEPLCPVCRKPLAPDELRTTIDQYKRERRALGEQYKASLAVGDEAKSAAADHRKRAAALQRDRDALDSRLREQGQALAARLDRAERAERELPEIAERLAAIRQTLDDETFAPEARERRDVLNERLAALGYDRERHAAVRKRLAELQPAAAEYIRLTEAKTEAEGLAERIAKAQEELERSRAECEEAEKALADARGALDASDDVSARLAAAEAAVAASRDRLDALNVEHGNLEGRRAALADIRARIEEARDKLAAARDSVQLYEELAAAFGRDGVQAMLIDQSLPELERIANDLLEQITEGRGNTQVTIRTQRETSAGKTSETLDIRISDDLGTRDYEMYSGGERFRVDFALRIALSRLLAMRSGATLSTLIIDEGFGTQDEEGRDRLVAAINAISGEFRLILLVTHIEELRESFGRRIEVTKDPERGSQAVVV